MEFARMAQFRARQTPLDACDCHMHIYDPRFALAGTWPVMPPVARVAAYREMQRELGLTRSVVVQPNAYGFDNACTEDAVRELGARARGVATVAPTISEAELDRLHRAGFRGARCYMLANSLISWEDMESIAARIATFGWHIDLQLDGRDLPQFMSRLRRLPVSLVIDHNGKFIEPVSPEHPGFLALLALLDSGRTWVKLSAPYETSTHPAPHYADVSVLASRLAAMAPERCVWASNWPHPGQNPPPSDVALLDLLQQWAPDVSARNRILVDNPSALYGF
jgi:D-galactarolactone isomerase